MSTVTNTITTDSSPTIEQAAEPPDFDYEIIIEPKSGWQLINWREFCEYRDLFRFLIWRNIKVRYAQSTLGIGWAIIQPFFSMVVFTVVFGMLANVASDGVPYAVFSFAALVPWTYFSNALLQGTNSLTAETNILSKVYFPRMMLPLSQVAAKLVDFSISMVILAGMMAFYQIMPNAGVLMFPLLVALMILTSAGLSLWLTALAVHYRDVNHAMGFMVQLMMYCSPVVYPASLIPWTYRIGDIVVYPRLIYSINPMVGVIEGFRSALLGTTPMPWAMIGIGTISAVLTALTGCLFFRKKERLFADVA